MINLCHSSHILCMCKGVSSTNWVAKMKTLHVVTNVPVAAGDLGQMPMGGLGHFLWYLHANLFHVIILANTFILG